MKKSIQKSIATLMALVMLVGFFPIVSFAGDKHYVCSSFRSPYGEVVIDTSKNGGLVDFEAGEEITFSVKIRENCKLDVIQIYCEYDENVPNFLEYENVDDSTYKFVMPDSEVDICCLFSPNEATGVFGDLITKKINVISKMIGMVPYELEAKLAEFIADADNADLEYDAFVAPILSACKSEEFEYSDYEDTLGIALILGFLTIENLVKADDLEEALLSIPLMFLLEKIANYQFYVCAYDEIADINLSVASAISKYNDGKEEKIPMPMGDTIAMLKNAKEDPDSVEVPEGRTLLEKIIKVIVNILKKCGFDDVDEEYVTKTYNTVIDLATSSESSGDAAFSVFFGKNISISEITEEVSKIGVEENTIEAEIAASVDTDEEMKAFYTRVVCFAIAPLYSSLLSDNKALNADSKNLYSDFCINMVTVYSALYVFSILQSSYIECVKEDIPLSFENVVKYYVETNFFFYAMMSAVEAGAGVASIPEYFKLTEKADYGVGEKEEKPVNDISFGGSFWAKLIYFIFTTLLLVFKHLV